MIDTLMPLIKKFLPFAQEKMGFKDPPRLFVRKDEQNAQNPLGKTAFYDPEARSVTLYTMDRHPKDVMRSLSHELVHHTQNCNGEFENVGEMGEGYAQNDTHLREMERQAYEIGNLCFRDWEDSIKHTIYFEHLQKGVEKVMSIKEWKNKEISRNLSEAWGFNFNLDRLDEKTGDDETRSKAEKSIKGKGTSKEEKDDLDEVTIGGVTSGQEDSRKPRTGGGRCGDKKGNLVNCGSDKCVDGPCKKVDEVTIGGVTSGQKDPRKARIVGGNCGDKEGNLVNCGSDKCVDGPCKKVEEIEESWADDDAGGYQRKYEKERGIRKKGYSSPPDPEKKKKKEKEEDLDEAFENPKSATGAGPTNKGGKLDRSDVANKDTSKFGQGSKSGSHKSAGGSVASPKAGRMDRSDVANKASGRWLKEECPPEDEMGAQVMVMGGGEEAPESRAMSLVDELRNAIMELTSGEVEFEAEEEVEMAERTKRDTPDRVAGRKEGGRRLKSLEETGLSETQLRELVKQAITKVAGRRRLQERRVQETKIRKAVRKAVRQSLSRK